ncbi:SMI1/KNR4 family protein [Plantactinospora sp. CA-294935]|uniref:SMI1/KNR4 family protein n=1 Tax=Plantactinospora sp. CA-294935 TaxID=3240012 RepID=UPI003D8D30C0
MNRVPAGFSEGSGPAMDQPYNGRLRTLAEDFPHLFELLPGMSTQEIDAAAERLAVALPGEVRQLLVTSRGIRLRGTYVEERFDDHGLQQGYLSAGVGWPSRPWPLSTDGGRGYQLVSVLPSGAWGPVLYTHNLLEYQLLATSFDAYLDWYAATARSLDLGEILDDLGLDDLPDDTDPWQHHDVRDAVSVIFDDNLVADPVPARIWTVADAIKGPDACVSECLTDLDDSWLVADLRAGGQPLLRLHYGERDEEVPARCSDDGLVFALRMHSPEEVRQVVQRHRPTETAPGGS